VSQALRNSPDARDGWKAELASDEKGEQLERRSQDAARGNAMNDRRWPSREQKLAASRNRLGHLSKLRTENSL
jgi:hypothetical protein